MHLYETHLPVADTKIAESFYREVVGLPFAYRDPTRDIGFFRTITACHQEVERTRHQDVRLRRKCIERTKRDRMDAVGVNLFSRSRRAFAGVHRPVARTPQPGVCWDRRLCEA